MATRIKRLEKSLESKVNYHSNRCVNQSYEIGEQNNKILEEQDNVRYKRLIACRNLPC
ncbi:hypothetical protein P4283_26010 [Bacillus thuringiensis]|nr:hypothetical protein [Bacillus thuringiensis]